ncbi:MAG: asparagine synthase-related protein [Brooklawnia sp.]|jgi:asparagine synthase (glutamine-hydrolysing)
MSYEILLIAGQDEPQARAQRLKVLEHAAGEVPGFQSSSVLTSGTTAAALVATSPVGGTRATTTTADGGHRITIATSRRGLAVPASSAVTVGAEAGHVTAVLEPDGAVFITTDGVGVLPAYWGLRDGTLFASTHLASLVSLGLGAETDELGLVEYLAMLHPMANRTLLRNATLLSAGASLRWQQGRTELSRQPLFMPASDHIDDDDAVGMFAQLWPEVISDALSGTDRPSIGLSGGLDSRAIAETAVALGQRPMTYTYGTVDTTEGAVGTRVAEALDLPHLSIPIADERLLAHSQETLALLDGAHSASEMYELWFADLLRSFTDVIVNGLDGGTLWGDDKAIGLSDPAAILERQWKRYAAEARRITPFLAHHLRQDAEQVVHRSLADSLAEWDLGARPDMVLFWRIDNRQQRWGAMLTNALRRQGLRSEIPFLDSRFLHLAARLSADQRRNGRLYLRVQREVFPRTAGIPRSDDGNPPRALNHVYWSGEAPFVRQLGRLTARHPISGARRGLRLGARFGAAELRARTGFSRPADWLDTRLSVFPADLWVRTRPTYAARLADLLEAGKGSSLIADDAVTQAVADLRAGRPGIPALTLGRVAAAQLWLDDYQRREANRLVTAVASARTAAP